MYEGSRTDFQGLSWTTTVRKSPPIKVLRKSSLVCDNDQTLDQQVDAPTRRKFLSTTMKEAVPFGPSYNEHCVNGTPFRRAQDVVRHYEKIDLGSGFFQDSGCIRDRVACQPLDEIYFVSRSSGRRQRYTSIPIQFIVWERCKLEDFETSQRIQNCWNRWRITQVRVEFNPRTHQIADSPQDSTQTGISSRSNHLHVHAQRQ